MSEPGSWASGSPMLGQAGVTLVEGSAFCISGRNGDIGLGLAHGLFFRDTRFLSHWALRVNEAGAEGLAVDSTAPFSATFVLRAQPPQGRADSTLVVFRHRYVGRGMREDLVIFNYAEEPAYCSVELDVHADFANLFRVKEGRAEADGEVTVDTESSELLFRYRKGQVRKGVRVSSSEAASTA